MNQVIHHSKLWHRYKFNHIQIFILLYQYEKSSRAQNKSQKLSCSSLLFVSIEVIKNDFFSIVVVFMRRLCGPVIFPTREKSLSSAFCVAGNIEYRVIQKKLFHKSEEKMQEKMKMILQKNENLVHVQQQYSVSFCEKIDSKSGFFQQIWHY